MAGKCPKKLEEQFLEDVREGTPLPILCETYGKAASTIKEWRTDLWHRGKLLWYPGIEMYDCLVYDDHIELEGDAVVVSDLEIPYHDAETLGYAISVGKLFGITNLILGGDILANDAVGHFATMAEDTDTSIRFTLADSLTAGRAVLQGLFEHFTWIGAIKGNHEQRATRIKEIGFFNMMRDSWAGMGNLEISYYKWCVVGGYRVEHPTYRRVPGSIARERAEIEDCSVLAAHTHNFSLSFTKNGKHQAVDLGHATREEARYYKVVNGTTPHPKWVRGFWVIRNGYLYPFPIDFTDWGFWLKDIKIKKGKEK